MSAHKETLIFCDGADRSELLGKECPLDGPYLDGDGRSDSAAHQRKGFAINGWLHRKGKDYCPACAKRLFAYEYVHGGSDGKA